MDDAGSTQQSYQSPNPPPGPRPDRSGLIGGLVLVTLGLLFLADNFLPDVRFRDFWPLILVVIGVGLLWKSRQNR